MKRADLKKNGFNLDSIIEFCRRNIRYISAGIVVVVLIIVLAVSATNRNNEGSEEGNETAQEQEGQIQLGEFEVDAIEEINTLVQNYFTAYAAGDTATLETYATPISEVEKSYITLMSQYVSGYANIQCHTKAGLNEGEYAVSVVYDMQFEGIQTSAPGLDFFYVRTNENGAYYIDNLYSQFNLQNREVELDSQIEEYIGVYESQADMVQLCTDVQTRYEQALAADADLLNMVDVTIKEAVQSWATQIAGNEQNSQEPTTEEPTAQEPTTQEPTTEEPTTEEPTPEEPTTEEPTTTDEPENSDTQTQENEGDNVNYLPEGTTIVANKAFNVREGMDENSERIGTVDPGEKIKVIFSYAEGWTKVEWKEKTGYIRTDLLLNN